jgi:putative nucleotidyltransferase with HDIG domain
MPQVPNWDAYAGYWVALVKGRIAGVGRTEREAFLAAKSARSREEPEVVYVSPDGNPLASEQALPSQVNPAQPGLPRLAEKRDAADYWVLPPLVRRVSALFQSPGTSGYLVGGSVRDLWLRRETHDLDLAVPGDALALGRAAADRLGGAYFPLDEERGVARVIFVCEWQTICLDISALRGVDIADDLRARDFTVNAMALPLDDLRPEALVDPTGGLADLGAGVLRMVAPQSFRDDPGRLLRAVRLAEELPLQMDAATEAALVAEAGLLAQVSPERVRDELNRMLALPRFGRCVREMDRLGLLVRVFPELEGLRGLAQPLPHLWDGLEHTIQTVEAVESLAQALAEGAEEEPWSGFAAALSPLRGEISEYLTCTLAPQQSRLALLKLAALLHDIGKPATRTEERGRIRFIGHPQEGARMAEGALARLRYSTAAVRMVSVLVGEHMWLLSLLRAGHASNRALYRFYQSVGDTAAAAGLLFLADLAATKSLDDEPRWPIAQAIVRRAIEASLAEPQVVSPTPLLDGRELMESLRLDEGPVIGCLLDALREAQAGGTVKTREEALAHAKRALARWRRMRHENR